LWIFCFDVDFQPDIVVTEELLRNMFASFGDIVDVTIKKAVVINVS
jgi:ureidoglycolate hydrolase